LSEQQAVAAAHKQAQPMSSTPVALISAASGHFSELGPRSELGRHAGTAVPDPNRAVWAVIFRGTFQGSCGPGL